MTLADDSLAALERAVGRLAVGEDRPGQRQMCQAVAESLESGRHLLVEAGTGVGKSLAYLVPAILSGQRVVIATATKALQDQLVGKDLPFLAEALDRSFDAVVLKGRSNYLCRARLAEAAENGAHDQQLRLVRSSVVSEAVPTLVEWAADAGSGERDDLPLDVSTVLWDALTVGGGECPGARKCPHGEGCFAERARERAREADIVVVNTHLYCLDLDIDGALVGEHDAVVVDEAHTLEETASAVFGLNIGPGRFSWLANQLKGVLVREAAEIEAIDRLGRAFGRALAGERTGRVDPGAGQLAVALTGAGQVVGEVLSTLRSLKVDDGSEARRQRVLHAADGLAREIQSASSLPEGHVAWIDDGEGIGLRVAPVDVGPLLAEHLFADRTAILTSATLTVGGRVEPAAHVVGLRSPAGEEWNGLRVDSPFDYREQAVLYCAAHLPDPREPAFGEASVTELTHLVEAAGGRTLALFTSYRAMHDAADSVADRWTWPVLVQDQAPRSRLLEEFRAVEESCLFATMAFWQGVDVPGDAVRLVVIDKLPFARPDEPLTQARREAAEARGQSGFEAVDLPRATRLLAQGAGRLVRAAGDRGVVAVLDRRLARAAYRRTILDSLPPMRRSVDRAEVHSYLRSLDVAAPAPA